MTPPPDAEHLALAPGARHSREEWERAAAAVLRKSGRLTEDDPDDAVWRALARTTLDGVGISPLGTRDLLEDLATAGRPTRVGEWDLRVHLDDPDAAAARRDLLTDLENGATSAWLQVGPTGVAVEALPSLLEGVLLDAAPVVLEAPGDPLGAARALLALRPEAGFAAGTNLGGDPVAARIRGVATGDPAEVVRSLFGWAADLGDTGLLALVVDGTAVHDLGASDAQELGYVLATAASYLRLLEDAGVPVADAAASLELRLAVSDEQFVGIAKLRAARRLWARMLELSGVSTGSTEGNAPTARVHAVTSRPMMTRYDPWVNMLRTCLAAFAAGVGGADAVTVLPFDTRLGLSDSFARRIARNTSSLLISESHLARVTDPAGGAWAVEGLTDGLAAAAWAELGRIEGSGGVLAALEDGSLQSRIDEVVTERDRQVADRRRPITGLSEFPNLHETLPERRPHPEGRAAVRPYGLAFEQLRDDPATGRVFLATMGTVAAHTARATFAGNLLAAGGIDTVNAGAHHDVAAVLSSYSGPDGGQPVVCLVGNDKAYAEWGAELVTALREAGARWVILAGRPGDRTVPADLVDDSCAVGVDALDFLHRTREKLA